MPDPNDITMPPVSKKTAVKTTLLKVSAIVVPVIVALTGYLWSDAVPMLRDICNALPPANVIPARLLPDASR